MNDVQRARMFHKKWETALAATLRALQNPEISDFAKRAKQDEVDSLRRKIGELEDFLFYHERAHAGVSDDESCQGGSECALRISGYHPLR